MICPNCNKTMPENSNACPHCGQPVIHTSEIIDAELVTDEKRSGSCDQPTGHFFFYRTMHSPFSSPMGTGVITFALAVAMGVKYGFLAILGFLFFYLLLSALSLVLRFNMLFKGYVLPPVLIQCFSWVLSWLIVTRFAS